jgi:hypothetical protein
MSDADPPHAVQQDNQDELVRALDAQKREMLEAKAIAEKLRTGTVLHPPPPPGRVLFKHDRLTGAGKFHLESTPCLRRNGRPTGVSAQVDKANRKLFKLEKAYYGLARASKRLRKLEQRLASSADAAPLSDSERQTQIERWRSLCDACYAKLKRKTKPLPEPLADFERVRTEFYEVYARLGGTAEIAKTAGGAQ